MQSLAKQFEAFCRSKPADEEYDYGDVRGCAIFQFLEAAGYPLRSVGDYYWRDTGGTEHALPSLMRSKLAGGPGLVSAFPWTFGALADRLSRQAV